MFRIRQLTLIVCLVGIFFVNLGIAQRQASDPGWLIQNISADSLIHASIWPNEGEYIESTTPEFFVSFELKSPAYVYLFNVSPSATSDAAGSSGNSIHMLQPTGADSERLLEAGPYTLGGSFVIPGPEGIAYLQLVATPLPLPLDTSDDEEFPYLGSDPELLFSGLRLLIESKGHVPSEWVGEWTSYAVRSRNIPFSSSPRCTKARIQVPGAIGRMVDYTIDARCVGEGELTGSFIGPTSPIISQVPEGEREISVDVAGSERSTMNQNILFGTVNEVVFTSLVPEDYFEIEIDPPNPSIWQEVTFRADVSSSRPIATYIWRFGDRSDESEGDFVRHTYVQETEPGLPYRVEVDALFEDNVDPVTRGRPLDVKSEPSGATCPPDTVSYQSFANTVVFESESVEGCIRFKLPPNMIELNNQPISGEATLNSRFSWESLPSDASVSASLFLTYERSGQVIDRESEISLKQAGTGPYERRIAISVPDEVELVATLMLNIKENPTGERITLKIEPLSIQSITYCTAAELLTRNPAADSEGNYLQFRRDGQVEIVFQNHACESIDIAPNSLEIFRGINGERILTIPHEAITIAHGTESTWIWPLSSIGSYLEKGIYSVHIDTSEGEYITRIILV